MTKTTCAMMFDVYVNKRWHRTFSTLEQVDEFAAAWFSGLRATDQDEIEVKMVYRRYYEQVD